MLRLHGVPIVVAVNKIDKPDSDPEKVVGELAQRDVIPESWGGDVMFANVSAKTGEGVNATFRCCTSSIRSIRARSIC